LASILIPFIPTSN